MAFTSKDVLYLSRLARLGVSESSLESITKDLQDTLAMIEKIESVDTAGIQPLAHPLDVRQPLREDKVSAKNQREELLRSAPACEAGLYLVPKVID